MIDQLVALIVDEGKWLTASLGFALLAVTIVLYRHRHSDVPAATSGSGSDESVLRASRSGPWPLVTSWP